MTYINGHPSPQQIAQVTKKLGLDRSLVVQYGIYMKNLVIGHWGSSLVYKTPVCITSCTTCPPRSA